MVNNGEIIGDVALGLFVVKKINDVQQTKKAAQELGITYEEMRLRKKAAKYRSKAASSQRPRRIQKYKAKAAAGQLPPGPAAQGPAPAVRDGPKPSRPPRDPVDSPRDPPISLSIS